MPEFNGSLDRHLDPDAPECTAFIVAPLGDNAHVDVTCSLEEREHLDLHMSHDETRSAAGVRLSITYTWPGSYTNKPRPRD